MGIVNGVPFLANKLAGISLGVPGELTSGGLIPLLGLGVGFRVASTVVTLFFTIDERVVNKLLNKILINYPYFFAVILFAIGVATIVTRSNMFKLLGLNIMESAVYLMFIAAGNIRGATEPIITDSNAGSTIINPLPSALMLTGIVVSVSVTAFALALYLGCTSITVLPMLF